MTLMFSIAIASTGVPVGDAAKSPPSSGARIRRLPRGPPAGFGPSSASRFCPRQPQRHRWGGVQVRRQVASFIRVWGPDGSSSSRHLLQFDDRQESTSLVSLQGNGTHQPGAGFARALGMFRCARSRHPAGQGTSQARRPEGSRRTTTLREDTEMLCCQMRTDLPIRRGNCGHQVGAGVASAPT